MGRKREEVDASGPGQPAGGPGQGDGRSRAQELVMESGGSVWMESEKDGVAFEKRRGKWKWTRNCEAAWTRC